MNMTRTKKLSIIFLTFICILAMGVAGVLLGTASYGLAEDNNSSASEIQDETFLNEEGYSAAEDSSSEDKLQSPDELGNYSGFVSFFPEGSNSIYTNFTKFNVYGYQTMNSGASMTILNSKGTNITSSLSWDTFDDGVWYAEQRSGWGKMGQRTTITLAPGEFWTFKINYTSPNNGSINCRMTLNCEPSEHWAYTNFADTIHWTTGTWVIDGDAPTGTVFRIYKICVGETSGTGYGYQTNYASGGWKAATLGIGYCTIWTYEITVIRSAPEKPALINDGNGLNVSYDYSSSTYLGTKIMTYSGEAATISFSPDYGSGVLDWSAVPANMQVQSRSNHGNESYNHTTIPPLVLETTTAGTYEITLRSLSGTWADGSRGTIKFRLIVYELKTDKPQLIDDDTGQLTTRTTKELNANEDGSPVTISFGNADPRYVTCSTGGLNIDTWSSDGTLTLSGAYVGTYTITLRLTNSNACQWSDGSVRDCVFTFTIKEIMLDTPSILRELDPSRTDISYTNTSKTVTYNGMSQSIVLLPAKFGSLTIVAPGLPATYFDYYSTANADPVNAVRFSTTNASSFTIKVRPATGYIWRDGSSTEYVFTFVIETVKLDSPVLIKDDTGVFTDDSKTVEYKFDSSGAVNQSITIKNFVPNDIDLNDAVDIITSMGMAVDKDGNFVFSASMAQEWLVAFTPKTNYEWKNLNTVPAFYLNIERRALTTIEPYVYTLTGNSSTDSNGTVQNNSEAANYVFIDGTTKIVNYVNENYNDYKFIKIYVGGYPELDFNLQYDIIIENSNGRPTSGENSANLSCEWEIDKETGKATGFLIFSGTQAENYLIKITPTDNFKWLDNAQGPDYESRDFKLIISPILHDKLSMYLQDSEGAWSPATADACSFDFDGSSKHVVIGTFDKNGSDSQKYDEEKMKFKVVDSNGNEVRVGSTAGNSTELVGEGYISQIYKDDVNGYGLHIYLRNAGEYRIYVTLKDGNYAWRGSASTEAIYYFTIRPQQIAAPELLKEDCHGKQNEDGTYDLDFGTYFGYGPYMSGQYFGDDLLMVIGLKGAEYIGFSFWTFPTDGSSQLIEDTDMSRLEGDETNGVDGVERLFITARNVGTHIVRLQIIDDNFCWAGDSAQVYYDFLLIIEYATVSDATFSIKTTDANGGEQEHNYTNGGSISVEFSGSEYSVNIGRKEYDAVDISSQFKISVSSSIDDISVENGGIVYGTNSIKVSALHAGTYSIIVSLDPNYRWNYNNLNVALAPQYFTLIITPKQVAVPKLVNNDYAPTDGVVDYDYNTRKVTFDRDTNWQLCIYLGEDYHAFSVSVDGLVVDNTFALGGAGSIMVKGDSGVEVALNDYNIERYIAYVANHAGDYTLTINLVNDGFEDYAWAYTEPITFILSIDQKGVQAPEAYVEDHNTGWDNTTAGNQMAIDSDNNYIKSVIYQGTEYWVYFKGEIIGYNTEFNDDGRNAINVTVTAKNNANADRMDYGFLTDTTGNTTNTNAYLLIAAQANTYTITVSLINGEDGDYYWDIIGDGNRNYEPKVFTLIINPTPMNIPYIIGSDRDPNATVVSDPADSYGIDDDGNYYAAYTYQLNTHRTIEIAVDKDLLNENYGFISVVESSQAKSTIDKTNGKITLTTNLGANGDAAAKVSGVYYIAISVGPNSCWTSSVADPLDLATKYFYIRITPLEVALPTLANPDSDNKFTTSVTYDPSKTSYGTASSPAITVNNFLTSHMTFGFDSSRIYAENIGTDLKGRTMSGDAGSYSINVNLRDPVNYKWQEDVDATTGDVISNYGSGALTFSFVVKPLEIASPKLVDDGRADADFSDGYTVTVTYNFNEQIFDISDYLAYSEFITLEVTKGVLTSQVEDIANGVLKVGAMNAGEYVITFTLSPNLVWNDVADTTGPISIKIIIKKLGLDNDSSSDMPHIIDDTGSDNITDTADGEQKVVTYVFMNGAGKEQYMNISNYDTSLFVLYSVEPSSNVTLTPPASTGTYKIGATDANTYKVQFKLVDSENRCWNSDETDARNDSPYIVFTFVIKPLELKAPKIEDTFLLDQVESVANGTFTTTYDSRVHTVLLKNILDSTYMTFGDSTTYVDPNAERLTIDSAPTASSGSQTVYDIFGFDSSNIFANPTVSDTTVVNAADYILFSATNPGKYYVTVGINESNKKNMVWVDDAGNYSTDDMTFVLAINKMTHAAPAIQGDSIKEYTGGLIDFYIENVYNGLNAAGQMVTFEYETYEGMSAMPTYATWQIADWYDGVMHLQAKEVGKYYITIKIREPENTVWTNTSVTSIRFTFEVKNRTLGAEVSYSSTDAATDADLQAGSTQWTLDKEVIATITLTGAVPDVAGVSVYNDITANVYFTAAGSTEARNVQLINPSDWIQSVVFDTATNTFIYTLSYNYAIPYGDGNITRNNYVLHVVQNGSAGNYTLTEKTFNFTVNAPQAPFDTDWLLWRYKIVGGSSDTNGAYIDIDPLTDLDANGQFNVEYLSDGGTYYFEAYLDAAAMGSNTEFTNALLVWEVSFDGIYLGKPSATYTGSYSVSVIIRAADLTRYYFAPYTFTLNYNITATKYNLTNLYWQYSHTDPVSGNIVTARWDGTQWIDEADGVTVVTMVYDGTPHTVKLISSDNNGALPEGLTVYKYEENNSQIYVGVYTISVLFTTAGTNYELPDVNDSTTYIGSFLTSCDVTVVKQKINVSWTNTQSSTGDNVTYIPVLAQHSEKVNYTYYVKQGSSWIETTDFTDVPNDYRAAAVLISNPSDPATDYARNYELIFNNPQNLNTYDFTLNSIPGITVTVMLTDEPDATPVVGTALNASVTDSSSAQNFPYTKNAYVAYVDSIVGGVGNLTIADNFDIKYYSAVNEYKPLAGAPSVPGNYIVKISLKDVPDDGSSYSLSQTTFYFNIEKGDFDNDAFIWVYTHTDESNNDIVATWDGYKWVDENNQQVTIVYDGLAHSIELVYNPDYPNPYTDGDLTVVMKNPHAFINAGTYNVTAYYIYDGKLWNDPVYIPSFSFTVEKVKFDLSGNAWDYQGDFEFEISGGKPVTHIMTILDLPQELEDYIEYNTYMVVNGVKNETPEPESSFYNAGSYVTEITFKPLPDDSNFEIVAYPVNLSQAWQILPKQIDVPSDTGVWTMFDGSIHNLLSSLNLIQDWETYFTLSIEFNGSFGEYIQIGTESRYTGSKYSAYNAGTYTFKFSIRNDVNVAGEAVNVVWSYRDSSTNIVTSADDQSVDLVISKAQMFVDHWTGVNESQKVVLTGTLQEYKYIDYVFKKADGSDATLDDVLASEGGDTFTIVAVIKAQYGYNVELLPANSSQTFVTPVLNPDKDEWFEVGKKPYLLGIIIDGVLNSFENMYTEDELKEMGDTVYVTYNGSPITFVIANWAYYSNYVDIWGGDDLTQNEAGVYEIKLILKTNTVNPRYWTKDDNGTPDDPSDDVYDRSSVTLKFEIRYLMLDVPVLSDDVTYTGEEINIIDVSYPDDRYSDWEGLLAQYGDYVEISGLTATNAGTYNLYLKIKDEYANTVVWNTGETDSQGNILWASGTYAIEWTIKPIYLVKPLATATKDIVYDGEMHSIREVLGINNSTDLSEEEIDAYIDFLWNNAHISLTNRTAVNAGTYNVTFSLPDSNYVWADYNPATHTLVATSSSDPVVVTWIVSQKTIDIGNLEWNCGNDDGDYFVYTLENGEPVSFSIALDNLPVELTDLVTFVTYFDPTGANTEISSASQVGSYRTIVYMFEDEIDSVNYQLGYLADDFRASYNGASIGAWLVINWEIKEREFTVPANNELTYYFDGNSGYPDLLEMLDFGDGWENYLTVSVRIWDDATGTYVDYEGVDGSVYLAASFGKYELSISIKDGVNVDGNLNVVWVDSDGVRLPDASATAPQIINVEYLPVQVQIDSWKTDNADGIPTIISASYDSLPDYAKDLFEYNIYEYDEYAAGSRNKVAPEDIIIGYTYVIEFTVKDEYTGALDLGNIQLTLKNGVTNPFEFGIYDFDDQPVIWLPLPVLDKTSDVFTAEELIFNIEQFAELYKLIAGSAYDTQVQNAYNGSSLTVPSNLIEVTNFGGLENLFLKNGGLEIEDGVIKAMKAGTYEVTVRFIPLVNLSWYDPAVYDVNSNGELCLKGSTTAIANTDNIVNRHSQTLKFEIKKASVTPADPNFFRGEVLELVYTGEELFITTDAEFKQLFEDFINYYNYGNLVTFENESGIDVDTYHLIIKLTDPDSSFWAMSTYTDVKYTAAELIADGYELQYVLVDGKWQLKLLKADENGNLVEFDGEYTVKAVYEYDYKTEYVNEFDAELAEFYVMENGEYLRYKVVHVNASGQIVPESEVDGYVGALYESYVKDANGTYFLRYQLTKTVIPGGILYDDDGNPVTDSDGNLVYAPDTIKYERIPTLKLDENNNQYVDFEKTVITVRVYDNLNGSVDLVDWKITSLGVPVPEILGNGITYTGKQINLADRLDILYGFDSFYMEIAEGGVATDVGTYEATIKFTDGNHHWTDADGNAILDANGEYAVSVILEWEILPIELSDEDIGRLNNAVWQITGGGETFRFEWDEEAQTWNAVDGYPTFTRKNGKAVTYKVELTGLPEVFAGHVLYTTNKVAKAHAGINAGKYVTEFVFDNLGNFTSADFELPDSLKAAFEWNIEKRVMPMPQLDGSLNFDGTSTFDLLELIGLERDGDWQEYFTITVLYASHNAYVVYEGYEGDKYTAFYAGSYLIRFNMLEGVNDKYTNLVWQTDDASAPSAGSSASTSGNGTKTAPQTVQAVQSAQTVQPVRSVQTVSALSVADKLITPAMPAVYVDEADGEDEEEELPSEGEDEDDDDIVVDPVEPEEPDPVPGDIPDITVTVGKLTLEVRGWLATAGLDAQIVLENGDKYLRFLDRKYYDIDGNEVTFEDIINDTRNGITYFIKYEVKAEYEQSVELIYKDGVDHVYSYTTNFSGYTEVEKPAFTSQTFTFTGKSVTFDLTEILAYVAEHTYLTVVVSESDLTATDVGNYVITISFVDQDEYCWLGGDRSPIYITWKIVQAQIFGSWNDDGTLNLQSNDYNGSYEGIVSVVYKDLAGNEVAFEDLVAGEVYIAEAILKDKTRFELTVSPNPFRFTAGNVTTLDRPALEQDDFYYTGMDITVVITNWSSYAPYVTLVGGTGKDAGTYTVTVKLNSGVAWSDGLREDITLSFVINKAIINGLWDDSYTLNPYCSSDSYQGSFDNIIRYEYYIISDTDRNNPLTLDDLVEGNIYRVYAILLDTDNFVFADSLIKVDGYVYYEFTYGQGGGGGIRIPIAVPVFEVDSVYYTGEMITFVITDWEAKYEAFLDIVSGTFRHQLAGEYSITLRLNAAGRAVYVWEDYATNDGTRDITLKFTIKKAILDGEWGNDGKVNFTSSYTGNYDKVVEYVYTDMDGNPVKASQLQAGVKYLALVRLKDAENFEFAKDFVEQFEFTYQAGSTFSWWWILLIILAIIVIIIIIIIIIIVAKRKKEAKERREEEEYYDNLAAENEGQEETSDDDYSDIYGDAAEEPAADDYSDIYGEETQEEVDGFEDIYGDANE